MLSEPVELDFSPASWRRSWTPAELASRLTGASLRWMVVGGWALDLHRGHQSRDHEDLEVAVPMWDFPILRRQLPELEFFVAGREGFWPVDSAGPAYFEYQQTFGREVRNPSWWRVDVMRIPDAGSDWVCSLDVAIRCPWTDVIARSAEGIPYLRPQWVLLYKATMLRERDAEDFDAALPLLITDARAALADSIRSVCGPEHPWLAKLG